MSKDDDLLKYYIDKTDSRLQSLEAKIDKLISFRVMLIGAAIGISGLVSAAFQVAIAIAGGR